MTGAGQREAVRTSSAGAIFILGILPRCGTNWLSKLLLLHPDCGEPEPIAEDFLLTEADRLGAYVDAVMGRWNPAWGPEVGAAATRDEMLRRLGEGLIGFLRGRTAAPRVVTKTPRVDRLDYFPLVFPTSHLVILVRDGRSVVESGVRSFGWKREAAIQRWAAAARSILAFDTRYRDAPNVRYRIIRYESLWHDVPTGMSELLDFLGLNRERYDFDAARSLPVYGSSEVRSQSEEIHWQPVEREPGFDPTIRWQHWRGGQHARFNYVAGECLQRLGYEPHGPAGTGGLRGLTNRLHDVKWLAMRTLGSPLLRLTGRRPPPR